jgi:hypothetical protein
VRLYERGDAQFASEIVFDQEPQAKISLNHLADADQDPLVESVGFDLQKEAGYEYLVLAVGENRDIDFGRFMMNVELAEINEQGGYTVLRLIRK